VLLSNLVLYLLPKCAARAILRLRGSRRLHGSRRRHGSRHLPTRRTTTLRSAFSRPRCPRRSGTSLGRPCGTRCAPRRRRAITYLFQKSGGHMWVSRVIRRRHTSAATADTRRGRVAPHIRPSVGGEGSSGIGTQGNVASSRPIPAGTGSTNKCVRRPVLPDQAVCYREARVIGARLTVAVKAALDSFALTVTQVTPPHRVGPC